MKDAALQHQADAIVQRAEELPTDAHARLTPRAAALVIHALAELVAHLAMRVDALEATRPAISSTDNESH